METINMNIPFVDLKAQYTSIKDEIDSAISEVISDTAFIGGPQLKSFQKSFAAYCGTKYCVGVGNGTDALFIALKTLGIGQGDEVITAANSFVATSEAITLTGSRVVFVDINPLTYNIDVEKISEKISAKTKAIVPVHLYGQPADMHPICEIAKKHGLYVVGDAAQAHGSLYHGTSIAKLADITCYSFYPGKNLGAYGDGGALVTDNLEWAEQIQKYANHGRAKKYDHDFEGINSRLDGLQAAILNVKLNFIEKWSELRRSNAYLYNKKLQGLDVITPEEIDDVRAVYHLYVMRIKDGRRRSFQEYLKEHGISTGIHYPIALPVLKAYRYLGCSKEDFPEAFKASQEIVSLPMYPELTEQQIDYVTKKISRFLA
jgi:dTDP-4-amino-4,6-dideoxygalactose transaminase